MSNDERWEVPALQDELKRKTVETFEWLVEQTSAACMSESEVKVALQTIFNVTAGLVSREVTDLGTVLEANPLAKSVETRVLYFYDDERGLIINILKWEVGSNYLMAIKSGACQKNEREGKTVKLDSPVQARAAMNNLANKIVAAGFKEF